MEWKIINTGRASAERNMALDYALLQELQSTKQPILHLYDWENKAATFGHFLKPHEFIRKEAALEYNLDLARRPTGGGIIFHLTDFAYSILIPAAHPSCSINTLDNYAFVNQIIIKVVQKFLGLKEQVNLLQNEPVCLDKSSSNFCMAKPTIYDVMWKGKKIGGSAQRRTKYGFLHQGSVSLIAPPQEFLKKVLLCDSVHLNMEKNSAYLLDQSDKKITVEEAREALKGLITEQVVTYENVLTKPFAP